MIFKLCVCSFLGLCAVIAAPTQAQSIYLHSPSEQQTTADLVVNLEAARTAHLAALDRHDAALEAAVQREQAAVVRSAFARRDVVVARHLAGDAATLRANLQVRLQSLTGDGTMAGPLTAASPDLEARLLSNLDLVRTWRLRLDRRQAELRLAMARGDVTGPCELTQLLTPAERTSLDQNECLTARIAYEALIKLVPCDADIVSRTTLAALAGVKECWANGTIQPLTLAGEFGDAVVQRRNLGEAVARQNAAARLVKDELAKLEKHLACERARAAQPGATERISRVAGQIDDLLAFVTQLNLDAPTVPPEEVTAAAAEDLPKCEAKNEQGADVSAEPVSLRSLVKDLKALVSGAANFDAARGILASASEAAQVFRASKLGEILQAVATPGEDSDDRTGTIVRALLRTATPIERLAQVRAGTLPDTSGALVALAEARMRAATAALEAERLTRLEALAQQKIAALSNEIALTRTAMGAGASSDRALVLYAASIERGRIPAEALDVRMNAIEYEVWSKRERVAVEAGYAVLAPAAAELQTYGEGGIRPDTIARFLNVAGLAAIAESN